MTTTYKESIPAILPFDPTSPRPVVAVWKPRAPLYCPNCGEEFTAIGKDEPGLYDLFSPGCPCWTVWEMEKILANTKRGDGQ